MCNIKFSSEAEYQTHINSTHEGKKPWQCPNCDYSVYKKASLTSHIANVHNGVFPEKKHICEICDTKFLKKSDMEKHVRAVHEKLKPFPCDRCGKAFSEKGHLNKHVETVHEGIRKFKVLSNIADQTNHIGILYKGVLGL